MDSFLELLEQQHRSFGVKRWEHKRGWDKYKPRKPGRLAVC